MGDLCSAARTVVVVGLLATMLATLDSDDRTLVLQATSSGAEVDQRELPSSSRAELREPVPMTLD